MASTDVIHWSDDEEDDPSYDLCGQTPGGMWCDVVHNYQGKWIAQVDLVRIGEFDQRELGREACEAHVRSLRAKLSPSLPLS